jgi:hypothetical protein
LILDFIIERVNNEDTKESNTPKNNSRQEQDRKIWVSIAEPKE